MILDSVENIDRYIDINSRMSSMVEFLKSFKIENYKKGKIEIDNQFCYAIGLEYETKDSKDCLWEAHRKYIDIHVLVEGEEKVHINNIKNMKVSKPYDNENDYALYTGNPETELLLVKNKFLLLFPDEVHRTSIVVNDFCQTRKLVFKVLI